MKKFLILLLLLQVSFFANAQLNKNTWLVGGNGKFYSYKSVLNSPSYNNEGKFTQIDLSVPVGYFVADKLAFGLKPTFSSIKGEITTPGGLTTNVQRYWIGPFGRYYILNMENQYNIVTEASYQFGLYNFKGQGGNLRNFSVLAGPVIYFNTSVGIEFLLGYSYSKEDIEQGNKETRSGFQIGLGLQIHLEKQN
jgi:hypothetical protein